MLYNNRKVFMYQTILFLRYTHIQKIFNISSIQFSHSVVSDPLWFHGLQHARLFCTPLSPGGCLNSGLLSLWCYITISSSAALFSFCLQSFPASGSFPMSWLFTSGGQTIGASASATVLPVNIQGWFPLGLTCLTPCSPSDTQRWSPAPQFKSISSLVLSLPYCPALTSMIYEIYRTIRKTIALTIWTFAKWCLCFLLWEYNFGW